MESNRSEPRNVVRSSPASGERRHFQCDAERQLEPAAATKSSTSTTPRHGTWAYPSTRPTTWGSPCTRRCGRPPGESGGGQGVRAHIPLTLSRVSVRAPQRCDRPRVDPGLSASSREQAAGRTIWDCPRPPDMARVAPNQGANNRHACATTTTSGWRAAPVLHRPAMASSR
jgi:hypothetical protein